MTTEQQERRRAKNRLIQSIERSSEEFRQRLARRRAKNKEDLSPQEIARREKNRLYMASRRASSEEFREKARICARAYAASHREERRLYTKSYRLERDYGIGWAEFSAMLTEQNGECAICGVVMTPPARASKNSVAVTVDHCHETGKVRGLLCYSCNLGMGIFKDSLERIRAAAAYLERHIPQ